MWELTDLGKALSNGTNVFYFLSSLLSTLNYHCIAGAGLPIHMIVKVSWEP
jgi:hypothetical protein